MCCCRSGDRVIISDLPGNACTPLSTQVSLSTAFTASAGRYWESDSLPLRFELLYSFRQGPSFALSARRYPFVWVIGVLNGTRVRASRYGIRLCSGVSLWDSLVFERVLEY